jgi:hypothetical protein
LSPAAHRHFAPISGCQRPGLSASNNSIARPSGSVSQGAGNSSAYREVPQSRDLPAGIANRLLFPFASTSCKSAEIQYHQFLNLWNETFCFRRTPASETVACQNGQSYSRKDERSIRHSAFCLDDSECDRAGTPNWKR